MPDGRSFATAEHYMMWRKADLFSDGRVATRILAAAEDPDARRPSRWRGRNLLGFALMHVPRRAGVGRQLARSSTAVLDALPDSAGGAVVSASAGCLAARARSRNGRASAEPRAE